MTDRRPVSKTPAQRAVEARGTPGYVANTREQSDLHAICDAAGIPKRDAHRELSITERVRMLAGCVPAAWESAKEAAALAVGEVAARFKALHMQDAFAAATECATVVRALDDQPRANYSLEWDDPSGSVPIAEMRAAKKALGTGFVPLGRAVNVGMCPVDLRGAATSGDFAKALERSAEQCSNVIKDCLAKRDPNPGRSPEALARELHRQECAKGGVVRSKPHPGSERGAESFTLTPLAEAAKRLMKRREAEARINDPACGWANNDAPPVPISSIRAIQCAPNSRATYEVAVPSDRLDMLLLHGLTRIQKPDVKLEANDPIMVRDQLGRAYPTRINGLEFSDGIPMLVLELMP